MQNKVYDRHKSIRFSFKIFAKTDFSLHRVSNIKYIHASLMMFDINFNHISMSVIIVFSHFS